MTQARNFRIYGSSNWIGQPYLCSDSIASVSGSSRSVGSRRIVFSLKVACYTRLWTVRLYRTPRFPRLSRAEQVKPLRSTLIHCVDPSPPITVDVIVNTTDAITTSEASSPLDAITLVGTVAGVASAIIALIALYLSINNYMSKRRKARRESSRGSIVGQELNSEDNAEELSPSNEPGGDDLEKN